MEVATNTPEAVVVAACKDGRHTYTSQWLVDTGTQRCLEAWVRNEWAVSGRWAGIITALNIKIACVNTHLEFYYLDDNL